MGEQCSNGKKLPSWQEFQQSLTIRAMKDEGFRKELLANPKATLEKEMGKLKEGAKLPASLEVRVIEQPADVLCLVLPDATNLSDEALTNVSGGYACGAVCLCLCT